MSRMAHAVSVAALITIGVGIPSTSEAQGPVPTHVRVTTKSERIMRWLGPQTDVMLVVDEGTTLEVLDFDKEKDWYWVILPPDLHGTRKVGWVRGTSVEAASAARPATDTSAAASANEAPGIVATQPQPTVAMDSTTRAATGDDKVSITVERATPGVNSTDASVAKKSYTFEDVHFDRDGFAIHGEDIERLRVAAAALKDDASLVVTIEGHTCNLGTGPYNLALGQRRADAVKEFLVNAGAPADRLVTVSRGEAGAEFDNSHEETRRLNRRVAIVPKIQR